MTTLILATRNQHKVEEIRAILGSGFSLKTLDDFPGAPAVVEDADTFAGNASKKARELSRWLAAQRPSLVTREPPAFVLADDSGLEVDALAGAPGVRSARFAADETSATGNSPDAANNAKLLRLLKDIPTEQRAARFRCVLALVVVGAERLELFDGASEGRIAFAPSGHGGFGYDPLFIPNGHDVSFAELGEAAKNQISHRARALAKLQGRWNAPPGQ